MSRDNIFSQILNQNQQNENSFKDKLRYEVQPNIPEYKVHTQAKSTRFWKGWFTNFDQINLKIWKFFNQTTLIDKIEYRWKGEKR